MSKSQQRPAGGLFSFTSIWTLCCLVFWYGASAGTPHGNAVPASGATDIPHKSLLFVLAQEKSDGAGDEPSNGERLNKNTWAAEREPAAKEDVLKGTTEIGNEKPDGPSESLIPDTLYNDTVFNDSVSSDSLVRDSAYGAYDSLFQEMRGEEAHSGRQNEESEHAENLQEERNRMYFFNFLWDVGEWYEDEDKDVDDSGDGDHTLAAVLFVLLGIVVVAVFIVGGAVFLVDTIIHNKKIPYWREFAFTYTYADNSIHPAFEDALSRTTQLAGLQVGAGLQGKYLGIGLNSEWGYLDMGFRSINNGLEVLRLQAFYGMAGPLVRLGSTGGFHVDMDFLSGFTSTESLGWLGKAKLTAKFPLGNHLVFGAHLGSLYSQLEPLEGVFIQNYQLSRQFSLLAGMQLGVRF